MPCLPIIKTMGKHKITRISFTLILLAIAYLRAFSAQAPTFLIQNYSINDYKASCQNWEISVSHYGVLYIANNSGLLTFDGNNWELYPLPDKSPIERVVFHNDTIYTKGEKSLGYWTRSEHNEMFYHPIDRLPSHVSFRDRSLKINLPDEVLRQDPTVVEKVGEYYVVGTSRAGLYFLDESGHILRHLSTDNQLQDNIVHSICVQDVNLLWVGLDNGIAQIDIDKSIRLLAHRRLVGKVEAATLIDSLLVLRSNAGYFSCNIYEPQDQLERLTPQEGEKWFEIKPRMIFQPLDFRLSNIDPTEIFTNPDNIYPAPQNLYWLTKGNEAGLFEGTSNSAILKCRILFDNYGFNLISSGQQIFPISDSLSVVSVMQGVLVMNIRQMIAENIGGLTLPQFNKISYQKEKDQVMINPSVNEIILPNKFQELSINIRTTVFTPNHQVSYLLEGITTEWSPWQQDGNISFLQLPEGEYLLHIRKYVAQGPFPEITIPLIVKPAWYNTVWAYLAYVVSLLFLFHSGINYYMRLIRQKEERVKEEQEQQEQQRLQKMKEDFLEGELKDKSNELMLQTTALVKRNQAIQSLVEELDRQKETLGDRYPNKLYKRLRELMEEALNDQADWIQFESYFNRAHQNFIERIRQDYSDITTGDLRICCLLRMNLSTKEIASLLNISVRAVELRRYRLRKRLGLEGDTNLVEFLINY